MNALFSSKKSNKNREQPRKKQDFVEIDGLYELQHSWKRYTILCNEKEAILKILHKPSQEGLLDGITPMHLQTLKEGLSDFQKAYELKNSVSIDDVLKFLKVKRKKEETVEQFSDFLNNFEHTKKVEEYRKTLTDWLELNPPTLKDFKKNRLYMQGIKRLLKRILKDVNPTDVNPTNIDSQK